MSSRVYCDISISADGYVAGPGQTADKPFGDGPVDRLHAWMFDTPDETIVGYLQASDATVRVAQLRVLGGAMARVPADATAFAHRASPIMVNVAAFYDGPADRGVRQRWVAEFASALQQRDTGAYVGFLGEEGPQRVRQAYPGSAWERLTAIKGRYDPANLLHRNQTIT